MLHEFLQLSPRISVLPVIHGSGDFAVEVRRVLLAQAFDCLAVPLPASFQDDVEQAIDVLPRVSIVIQGEQARYPEVTWDPADREEGEDDAERSGSYVPIDPCQPVIAALRVAIGEHIPRAFVDLETRRFLPVTAVMPDPYAVRRLKAEKFAAGILPALGPLPAGQPRDRVITMANRLRDLERKYERVLFVCSLLDWPWIKEAYSDGTPQQVEDDPVEATDIYAVAPRTLLFLLGELPHITGLYEQARADLDDDSNLSIDGVKEVLLASRDRYQLDLGRQARRITPQLLSTFLKYVRNLSLIDRRLTPSFSSLVIAAQQLCGDQFAIHLAELAREYPFDSSVDFPELQMGIGRAQLPEGDVVSLKSRLPGPPLLWRGIRLTRRPPKLDQRRFRLEWNPFRQCSWPPEDNRIERFRTHVTDRAMQLLGQDLAQSEKFTTSLKDGLDIRETLRNWHTGSLYVKVVPPSRGRLDCVVMLFDSPADPRDYPWRITWHAEHHDESTLSLFATDYGNELVGPGIAQSLYGGAMFLFPPRPVADIWRDPQFDVADTLEERMILAACHHARERHIALLSDLPPGLAWRRLAKRCGKRLLHVPLAHFSQETVQQLRTFHVLNGQQVRSYAEHFIRKV